MYSSSNPIFEWMTNLLTVLFNLASQVGLPYWGVAIILLTVIIKTALYPLQLKQMRSMRGMTRLQPKIKELQQKYKDQPQKINTEIAELYKKHNINPLAGCLPLLIQLPILFSLYGALLKFDYGTGVGAHFIWFNMSDKHDPLFILPVLAAITTYLQTKVTTPNASTDPTQKIMLYMMPIFLGYISATVPPGLALYWVVMNVVTILQQIYINRKLAQEDAKTTET